MKKYNFLFLFLLLAIQIQAQNISVKSFRLLENDLDARVNYPKKDQNGEKCAIIKVVTTEDGFTWDGDALGITAVVKKQAEYWLYVPRGVKRITISHSKLGLLRNYAYSIPIDESSVYELVLVTGKVVTTVQENEIESQWLIINTEPAGADVYINDQPAGKTPYQNELPIGKYTWRLQKELFLNEAGIVELKTDSVKQKINITLKSNYGSLNIKSEPEVNAMVYINGMNTGKTTPCIIEKVLSGEKTIKLTKNLYEFIDKQLTVMPESNQEVSITAKPTFGTISISTKPESDAIISIDGQSTGKVSPCKLEFIPVGEHNITVAKEMYETTTQKITLVSGETKTVMIDMKPTFSLVNISTEPTADIFINGEFKANGNWQGKLNPGIYTFEAKLDKHITALEKKTINLEEPLSLTLTPIQKTGNLKIISTPFDATIMLNDKNYGTTPATLKNLLIGDYTLTLSKDNCKPYNQTISIEENKTIEVNEKLISAKEVTITSIPTDADLNIDGKYIGKTPQKLFLSFGDHQINITLGNRILNKKIKFLTTDDNILNFDIPKPPLFSYKQFRGHGLQWNVIKAGYIISNNFQSQTTILPKSNNFQFGSCIYYFPFILETGYSTVKYNNENLSNNISNITHSGFAFDISLQPLPYIGKISYRLKPYFGFGMFVGGLNAKDADNNRVSYINTNTPYWKAGMQLYLLKNKIFIEYNYMKSINSNEEKEFNKTTLSAGYILNF